MNYKKWLYNCSRSFALLNHFCQCDNMEDIILEIFPIFKKTGIYFTYMSYQNGESCTTLGVYPDLNLIVEFPYGQRKTVEKWFAEQDKFNDFSLFEVNFGTWALEYNIHQLISDLYGDEK